LRSWRLRFLIFITIGYAAYLLYPLFSLQIWKRGEKLRKQGKGQFAVKVELPAKRGEIYDRYGRPIALNIPGLLLYQVKAPLDIPAPLKEKYKLKPRRKLKRGNAYLLAYGLPYNLEGKLRNLDGIYIKKNWLRDYPYGESVSTLVGIVGMEGHGLEGLEYILDRYLAGKWGYEYFLRASNGQRFSLPGLPVKQPQEGKSFTLTIDADLQEMVYWLLKEGVEETEAKGGFVIVLNPRNGEILAMTNYPSASPSSYFRSSPYERRNRILTDPFEPGSTFKIVLYSYAFERKIINPDDSVDTGEGYLIIQKRKIRDVHPLGKITYRDAIIHSSNVAASLLALSLDKPSFYEMIRRFGFGCKTGVLLPGESEGYIPHFTDWDSVRTANIAIGHGILVNGLQMAMAYASLANGGFLLTPKIIKAVDGEEIREKIVIRKVLSDSVINLLKEIFTEVVEEGTGNRAKIPGVKVAGKTGTAIKVDPITKTYDRDKITVSFIGFFPVSSPKYLIYVVIDEPVKEGYGGTIAAPLFKKIALEILRRDTRGIYPALVHSKKEGYIAYAPLRE
jgi:cell division protein FtsI (penicillin-binding protein 3)